MTGATLPTRVTTASAVGHSFSVSIRSCWRSAQLLTLHTDADNALIVSSVALPSVAASWLEVPTNGVCCVRNLSALELCAHYDPLPARVPVVADAGNETRSAVWQLLLRATHKRCVTLDAARGVRLLFSGGVDSTLLAVALHLCLALETHIALVNVAFADSASDRAQSRGQLVCRCRCNCILLTRVWARDSGVG